MSSRFCIKFLFLLILIKTKIKTLVGSNPTEGKIRFSQITLFYRVECENLFCKTNLKLKVLKLIKTKTVLC